MTFHLTTGGVKLAHFLREGQTRAKQLIAQLALVGAMLALVPPSVIAAPDMRPTPLIAYDVRKSQIRFAFNAVTPLATVEPTMISFAIGESKVQEQMRLEAEIAARAKAVALAARSQPKASRVPASEPGFSAKRALAQAAAAAYGIPWEILEAVWEVESGKSWDTHTRSSAGARGPAQFMPATWRRYGVDGNGDGAADIHSAEDAVYGAANYLAANGAARDEITRALYAYNHAGWYVQKVLRIAREIGYTG